MTGLLLLWFAVTDDTCICHSAKCWGREGESAQTAIFHTKSCERESSQLCFMASPCSMINRCTKTCSCMIGRILLCFAFSFRIRFYFCFFFLFVVQDRSRHTCGAPYDFLLLQKYPEFTAVSWMWDLSATCITQDTKQEDFNHISVVVPFRQLHGWINETGLLSAAQNEEFWREWLWWNRTIQINPREMAQVCVCEWVPLTPGGGDGDGGVSMAVLRWKYAQTCLLICSYLQS